MKIKIKRDLTLIRRIEYQTMVVNNVTIIININLIVKRYVKKSTTIYTDLWKGYNNLKNIGYINI